MKIPAHSVHAIQRPIKKEQAPVQFGAEPNQPVQPPANASSMSHRARLPLAALGIAGMFAPGLTNVAEAAITPESDRLVQALSSNDEHLIEAALVNLANVNEQDALPHVKRILTEAKLSEDTLRAAARAAGSLGAKASPQEKASISRILMPYLSKVVGVDKDKNIRFLSPVDASDFAKEDTRNKVKDLSLQAAQALGKIGEPNVLTQLSAAAQDGGLPSSTRALALEAILAAPANAEIDQQMIRFYDRLNPKTDSALVGKLINIFLKHNVADGWTRVEKLFAPETPTTPTPATPTPPGLTTPTPAVPAPPSAPKGVDETRQVSILFGPPPVSDFSPAQTNALNAVLKSKKAEAAPLILKQMAKSPDFFNRNLAETAEFFRAMGPEVKKQLLEQISPAKADALVQEANPKKSFYAKPEDETADIQKNQGKARQLRRMSVIMTALLKVPDAGAEYRKIFTNSLEETNLRHLGVAASAYVKDAGATNALMGIATDDTESADLRFDALSAVMEITTPPLAKDLQTNTKRIGFLQRYLTTFSDHPQFTQSVFKAELFNDIRESRKALIRANAPLKDLDEMTLRHVDRILTDLRRTTKAREELMKAPGFKEYEAKLVNYVSKNANADGFLRVLMIGMLGESKSADAKPALKELINNPLTRTQIPDVVSSNDMMMFPGYTKQTVASATRLAAISALGQSGDMGDSELIERALRSDDRRLHMTALNALADLGENTSTAAPGSPAATQRKATVDRMIRQIQRVNTHAAARMDNFFQKLYAQAIDKMGGTNELLDLMDKTENTVLKRAIANGLIRNGKALDNPRVAQHLLSVSMGVDELHKKGIDGRGQEIAIIDGDYINDDLEGLAGRVTYPDWGNTRDASLRESFHGESVASVMVGRRSNVTYGIAPGVDRIYSYAAWDDNMNADPNAPIEEVDGMLRSLDDIIAKKIAGKSKVSVVNMSLGGTSALLYGEEDGGIKDYLAKLAARFEAGSKAGITFVISAGNEGGDSLRHHLVGTLNVLGFNRKNGNLAQSKGVILVGATDTHGSKDRAKHAISFFSSIGDVYNTSQPDVVAPGTNIPLLNREEDGAINIDEMDGTSFSAPVTAATILLMNQAAGKPMETEMIRSILGKTAYQLEDTPRFQQGAGSVDPLRAVEAATNARVSGDFNRFLESLGSYLRLKEQPAAPNTPASPPSSGQPKNN